MNLDDLTIGQARQLAAMFPAAVQSAWNPFEIGRNYIVRTVTMIYTGKLIEVGPTELVMTDVSWIPETARYAQFVADGEVNECEPYPAGLRVVIGRGALLDAVVLTKSLPRSQK